MTAWTSSATTPAATARPRAHSTLGDLERHDVAAAVDAARDRSDRVVLVGASMGAIAALRYAAATDDLAGVVSVSCPARWRLPRNLRGVAAAGLTRTRVGRALASRWMGVQVAPRWTEPGAPGRAGARGRVRRSRSCTAPPTPSCPPSDAQELFDLARRAAPAADRAGDGPRLRARVRPRRARSRRLGPRPLDAYLDHRYVGRGTHQGELATFAVGLPPPGEAVRGRGRCARPSRSRTRPMNFVAGVTSASTRSSSRRAASGASACNAATCSRVFGSSERRNRLDHPVERGVGAERRAQPVHLAAPELEQRVDPEAPSRPSRRSRDAAAAHEVVEVRHRSRRAARARRRPWPRPRPRRATHRARRRPPPPARRAPRRRPRSRCRARGPRSPSSRAATFAASLVPLMLDAMVRTSTPSSVETRLDGGCELARRGSRRRHVLVAEQLAERALAFSHRLAADRQPHRHNGDPVTRRELGGQRGGAVGHDGDGHRADSWAGDCVRNARAPGTVGVRVPTSR